MSLSNTALSFEVIDSNNCQSIIIADTSVYNEVLEGQTMLIRLPDKSEVKEIVYSKNSLTILNSNSLGYTKVYKKDDLQDLPDGLYTIKITICPYEIYWYEKDYYRVCKLKCKYYKAVLKLDLSKCEKCYTAQDLESLNLAKVYIEGIEANAWNNDINAASALYKSADKILDNLLSNCKDCGKYRN